MNDHSTSRDKPGTVRFTQTGTLSIAILLPLSVFCLVMIFVTGFRDLTTLPFGFLALSLIICLLTFFKITITIDEEYISFSLGIGIVRKKYPLHTIANCKPVLNSVFTGIGIRMLTNGWLYNVSGRKAVELSFRDRKHVVRIGTDKPEAVAAEISRRLNVPVFTETTQPVRHSWYLPVILIVLLIFVPILLIVKGSQPSEITLGEDALTIEGMYGLTVNYKNILEVDTVTSMPHIRVRTNGFAAGSILKGNFRLAGKQKAKMFVNTKKHPFLRLETQEIVIYLNRESRAETISLYEQIKARKAEQ